MRSPVRYPRCLVWRGREMNGVAATRAVYAEQWLHEHRDELPDDIIEYIEQLRNDWGEQARQIEELEYNLQRHRFENGELRKRQCVGREAQG